MGTDGTLIPVGEVTGMIQQSQWKDNNYASPGASGGQPDIGATGTPAAPAIGEGGQAPQQNKTPDYVAPTPPAAGDIPDGGVGVSVVPQNQETKINGSIPTSWYEKGISEAIARQPELSINEHIKGYNDWAEKNGKNSLDIMEIFDLIKGKDPNKSVAQNELDEKKAKRKEDWERFGNFLQHLGNFVGVLNGGLSVDVEPAENLTKRQQMLRDRTLALRDNEWQKTYQAYKNKMDNDLKLQNQELKAQQIEANIKLAQEKLNDVKEKRELEKFKADTDRDFKKATAEYRLKALEVQQRLAEKRISIAEANTEISRLKQEMEASGKTTEKQLDALGNVIKEETKYNNQPKGKKKKLPGAKKSLPGKK